jgi:AcrR family transcriptional regulator
VTDENRVGVDNLPREDGAFPSPPALSAEPPRQPRGRSGGISWEWARTAGTRRALLEAAREVFVRQGFADSRLADVVRQAHSSVGSLYHHFGGKNEIYVALWHEHQEAHEREAWRGITSARRVGATDAIEMFSAGARAYLQGSWERRDLEALFLEGDGPPGFEALKRRQGQQWIRENFPLVRRSGSSTGRMYEGVLISLITEGGREAAAAGSRDQANEVASAVIEYARRVMTPRVAVRSARG